MEAVALYAYKCRSNEEISFNKGDIIKILNESDKIWYQGEFRNQVGLVPANYVQFDPPSWYMSVSKDQAATLLSKKSGSNFLVRPSETTPGQMSLSVFINDVEHFKILRNNNGYYMWSSDPQFMSINKLVEYYKRKPVSSKSNVTLTEKQMPIKSQFSKCKQVRAEYDFDARSSEELTIYKDEIINVIEEIDNDWISGSVNRNGETFSGLFPANYISHL